MGSILGIIGIGLGIIGIAGSYFAAKDQQKALDRQAAEENKVRELEFRKQAIKERREKFKLIREARIKRAATIAAATVPIMAPIMETATMPSSDVP